MTEPTDPRILALAKARQQIGHKAYGSTAHWNNLKADEQRLFLDEAAAWLAAAVAAGIAPSAVSDFSEATAEERSVVEACGKCKQPLDPARPRTRRAHEPGTAYCRRCVDRCHDSEIADHRCVICA